MRASSYVVLFFVITFGVAAGNLLSSYVTAVAVAYEMEKLTAELEAKAAVAKGKSDRQAAANRKISEANRERLRLQQQRGRANGSVGKRLIRECAEWQRAASDTESSYAADQAWLICRKKDQYLETGTWNPKLGS